MGFINDDYLIFAEISVLLQFSKQNTVSHQLDYGIV